MKRDKLEQFALSESGPRNQYAALCWRLHKRGIEVLLITSRDTGRWILPKGWPMGALAPAQAAAIEAWEEAGVHGVVSDEPLSFYSYDKVLVSAPCLPCLVTVFPLHVTALAARFPERKERRRKWFSPEKAAKKVAEPELRALLHLLADDPLRIPAVAALAQS